MDITGEELERSPVLSLIKRVKTPAPKTLVLLTGVVAVFLSLFHLYTGVFGTMLPYLQTTVAVTLLLIGGFLFYPLGRKSWREKPNRLFALDVVCILLTIAITVYVFINYEHFVWRVNYPVLGDVVCGTITLVLVLEVTRRTMGWSLVGLCLFFLVLVFMGEHLPGRLRGATPAWDVLISVVWMQPIGIHGMVTSIMTQYLIMFLVLVEFLSVGGGAQLFINVALSMVGRLRGGPAKVAVIGAAAMGTMTGSAVADTVGIGAFTIPMMKSMGFKSEVAAAVQATASTGAQIMPPILGTAAFLMAEFLGISYFRVCLAAIIPALLYFASIYWMVDFEAAKMGIKGLTGEGLPRFLHSLTRAWPIIVPIITLVAFLALGYRMSVIAVSVIALTFFLTLFSKETRMSPGSVLLAFERGARTAIYMGGAFASIGIIIGAFVVSDLGIRISGYIADASGGHLWLALLFSAILSLLLGMAVPTPVAYLTVYLICVPLLVQLGVNTLAANFFAFYFAIISSITPPVAVAAFAGAGLAKCSPMRTGFIAMKIAIVSYFVPFAIVYAPEMLLEGPLLASIVAFASGFISVALIAAAVQGWFLRRANIAERVLLCLAGIGLLAPPYYAKIAGVVLVVLIVITQKGFIYGKLRRKSFDRYTESEGKK